MSLPSASVDWEVELVVAISKRAGSVAWQHVAGLMIGQDLSERVVQLAGPVPQFALGKSFPGFAPLGPALVTPDEVNNPDDLALSCRLGDEVLQRGRTRDMMFGIAELIARLSANCPLLPGDILLHWHAVGGGRGPRSEALPAAGQRTHQQHRGPR